MNTYFFISKILSPFFLFSNLLIFLFIFLFFLKKKIKFIFNIYLIFFIVISLFPIGKILEHHYLKKEFYNKEIINDFDAILVLGGNERRIIYAIDIMKKYQNVKLVFAGGGSSIVKNYKSQNENESFKNLIKNLLNENEYFVLNYSRNTLENLLAFKKFNEGEKLKKVILLTNPSHMKRSLAISKKIGLNLTPYYWEVDEQDFSLINHYQNFSFLENLRSFDKIFRETLGILSLNFINLKN